MITGEGEKEEKVRLHVRERARRALLDFPRDEGMVLAGPDVLRRGREIRRLRAQPVAPAPVE